VFGSLYPGLGSVAEMSGDDIIDKLNSSCADFLVAWGPEGTPWLARNHHRLQVPIRAHLGAVVNFEAGTLQRAPFVCAS
jgi:N-acetylglucosaminyldiphosphoundecaprenol N-acetyl-beta-D-mannosaminyltransferase